MIPQEALFEKKEKLKKLFYTQLSAFEIKQILEISNSEYILLLSIVKQELGLPTSFKRNPRSFNKYSKNSYYIARKTENDEIEILSYAPSLDYAEEQLKEIQANEKQECIIGQASDEHMKELISNDYYEKHQKWDVIMDKYKLPYHVFYKLLKEVKLEKNKFRSRTSDEMRYIYQYNNKALWEIRKTLNSKPKSYGVFNDLNLAINIRDYLESVNWNLQKDEMEIEE